MPNMIRATLLSLALAVFSSAFLTAGPITLDKRERDQLKKETVYAIDLIQRYHYKQKSFSDIDSEALLKGFIEDLDSSRMFFLQEDVDFVMDRFGSSLKPSYLYVGDLFPAFEIFNLYYERISSRLEWVQDRLDEPFDFDTNEAYLSDRSEAAWPASAEEAERIWEQRLTNDLIMELLEDEPLDRARETVKRRYKRMAKFLDEIEVHNVQETFLTALAQLYDPHSNFFSWDSAQEFDIQISNALVGIGAQLRDVDGYCVIERLLPGGPAEMSGQLHPGDKIIAVAQGDSEPVDVIGMKLRNIVQQIRGEAGTEVRLTVMPAHSAKREIVPLIREKVELTANLASADIYHFPDDTGNGVRAGVIELPSFYGEGAFGETSISTTRDVEELINKLKGEDVDGIVLDLRKNGGGRLDEAVKLAGLFMSEGPVVMKRTFSGEIEEDWDRNKKVAWEGPLVVLVSRSSASASEIVAGALQSLGRAVVVGDEATHGKGTVQAPIDLRNAMKQLPFSDTLEVGTVKVTVQQFYLPNGHSTQNRGVIADVPLPSANMFLLEGEADLDNALTWDQIDSIEYQLPERKDPTFSFVTPDILENLRTESGLRVATYPEFQYLNKRIEWYRDRHERDTVSLNLAERQLEKDELERDRDFFEQRRNELSRELTYEVRSVDLELTEEKEKAHQAKLRETPLPNGDQRANSFYQKVYYHEDPEDGEIHEIWVEYFDYDKALDELPVFTALLSEIFGEELEEDSVKRILTRFKNRDRGSNFNVLNPFEAVLGDRVEKEVMLDAMPAFFAKMVEIDPDVLLERSKLDVDLRESLRVVRDWIALESPMKPTKVALNINSGNEKASSSSTEETTSTAP